MQIAKDGVALAGIEVLVFAIDLDDGDFIIQLSHIQVIGHKEIAVAVGHVANVCLQPRSTRQTYEETGDFIARAALLAPDCLLYTSRCV